MQTYEFDEPTVNNPDLRNYKIDGIDSFISYSPSSNTGDEQGKVLNEVQSVQSYLNHRINDKSIPLENIESDDFSSSLSRSKMLLELGEFNYAKQLLVSALEINPLSFYANLYFCLATYKLRSSDELKRISYDCPFYRILTLCLDCIIEVGASTDEAKKILSYFSKTDSEPYVGTNKWHNIVFNAECIQDDDRQRLENAFILRGSTLLGNDSKTIEGKSYWAEAEKEYLAALSINPKSSQGRVGLLLSRLQCHSFDDKTLIKRRLVKCQDELGEAIKYADDRLTAERLVGLKHIADSYELEELETFEKAQEIKQINDGYEEDKRLRQQYAGKVISELQSPVFRREAGNVIGEVSAEKGFYKNKILIESNLMGDFYDNFMVAYTRRMLGKDMPEFLNDPEKWIPDFRGCFKLTIKNEASIFDTAVKNAKKMKNYIVFKISMYGFFILFPLLIFLYFYLQG